MLREIRGVTEKMSQQIVERGNDLTAYNKSFEVRKLDDLSGLHESIFEEVMVNLYCAQSTPGKPQKVAVNFVCYALCKSGRQNVYDWMKCFW